MSQCRAGLLAGVLLALITASVAQAQSEPPAREASRHFQRGVDLYNEGDLRGALVEFKRAHVLLPRATVLYNIGQAEYQLQEYASALRTLERFLAETGPNAARRAEVQQTVEILRGRVGQITLTSDRAGCEVTVDEQSVGSTPLTEPIPVSIGRRRVAVSCPGGERATRDAEVAGGQTVAVDFQLGPAPLPSSGVAGSAPPAPAGAMVGRRGIAAGWIVSAGLATATLAAYTSALVASRQLVTLRGRYPTNAQQLTDRAKLTSRLALTGDILAVSTLAAAGLTAYFRASGRREGAVQVDVAATGLGLGVRGNF